MGTIMICRRFGGRSRLFKLKRDAGGFEGKNGEKRARRRAMGRRVVRVGCRVLAVAAVAGVVAANVAMAMMGDTVESYLGGDKIEVTSEEIGRASCRERV